MEILRPLASLRLTVWLFALSIVLVFVGTLAQEKETMWDVLSHYFRTWVSWVPLDVFFPDSFFPKLPTIPGKFPFPGGWSLGFLLALNLFAAHITRFKVQATGRRLYAGLGIIAAGLAITVAIVASGNATDGVTHDSRISWDAVWDLIRWSTALAWAGSVFWVLRTPDGNQSRFWLRAGISGLLGLIAFWLVVFGGTTRISDASLRIVWQLAQGIVAGLVLLWGCWLVFQRRAGIVVIHLGVALLMIGELIVSLSAVEERMLIKEGETTSMTSESAVMEIAVIDRSPEDHDRVVSIPITRLKEGRAFQHEALPFNIELIHAMKNSELVPISQTSGTAALPNPATTGLGKQFIARQISPVRPNSDAINEAAAYIRLTPKSMGDREQTVLLAQRFCDASTMYVGLADSPESVTFGGKTYEIAMRNRRNYKPYSLTLRDIRKDDYIGTAIPRDYSSYVTLNDPRHGVKNQDVRIWMNNPLRYAGETFYQSGYHPMRDGEATSLQLVTNFGWMIPYVACMLTVVGLVWHFGSTLTRFLDRSSRPEASSESRDSKRVRGSSTSWTRKLAAPAVALALVTCVAWSAARTRPTIVDGMNLTEFGRLPVIYQGRVKPMDTLARNALKVISNKQSFTDTTLQEKTGMPAIKWLLDEITFSPDAEQHAVYYIPHLETLDTFQLPREKHFMYSRQQLKPGWDRYKTAVAEAYEVVREHDNDPKALLDRPQLYHLYELSQRLRKIDILRTAFAPVPFPSLPTAEQREKDPQAAEKTMKEFVDLAMSIPERNAQMMSAEPPLTVPLGKARDDWRPYAAAINQAFVEKILHRQDVAESTLVWDNMLMSYAQGKADEFNAAVAKYQRLLGALQPEGVDLGKVGFETFFNRLNPFWWCMALYVFAFVCTAIGWLGWYEPLRRFSCWLIVFTFCLHTFGLIARIYISGRPPVTNLYSSAIFIGWGAVLLSILLEFLFRISIGNVVAAVAGFITLFIAHNLAGDGDTFTVLQAVLDTQFWLATHVVCVTLGYTTTFVAGALATIYLLGFVISGAIGTETAKSIARMTYGTICFALLFSFFGTVLGGLWADDSWGRFWGWDPKENGALIIVLWNALILHARWGGMVRDRGLAALAIAGNIATAWSWFGVNELGLGLHAYSDFNSSVRLSLALYAISQLVLIVIGTLPVAWYRRGSRAPNSAVL